MSDWLSLVDGAVTDGLEGDGSKLDRVVRVGAWVWTICLVSGVLMAWASVSYYRELWHWIPASWRAHDVGLPGPAIPLQPVWNDILPIVWALLLVTGIVFLVWQHGASSVAKVLGYPAHRSSGWGVATWFIPVANLWMPFQALRDCLPVGHSGRRSVSHVQASFIASQFVLLPTALFTSSSIPALSDACFVLVICGYLVLGFSALRMVTVIAREHGRPVGIPT